MLPFSALPPLVRAVVRALARSFVLLLALAIESPLHAADEAAKNRVATRASLTVSVARLESSIWPRTLEASGNIAAWQEASIGAEVPGLRLSEVRVDVGDHVRRGQVLATFADATMRAELAQASSAATEAEVSLAAARGNADRARALAGSGAMSTQEIEQYTNAAAAASARLDSARAARDATRLRLGFARVVAPDDGIISQRNATLGAVANPGQELFRMIRRGRLEWRAEVTAFELAGIRIGQRARVSLPGGAQVSGKVRALAPTVDAASRNAIVYVDLEHHADARAGMFARGEFALGAQPALSLPQAAVVARDGFSYVFQLTAGNRVTQRKVTTGRRVGERVEITAGLGEGDQVAATGAAFLADGDVVRVASEAPPTPPAKAEPAAAAKSATGKGRAP